MSIWVCMNSDIQFWRPSCLTGLGKPNESKNSSPGPVWSVKRRSRGCLAPHSCWPARRKRELGSRCVRAAGTAARSRGAPLTRCLERLLSYMCKRDKSLDSIYCLPGGGWWCSHHQTCKMKTSGKHNLCALALTWFDCVLIIAALKCEILLYICLMSYMSVYLFFRCCTDPRHWNLPLTMIAILVQRASHSSILNKNVKTQNQNTVHTRWGNSSCIISYEADRMSWAILPSFG